MPRAYEGLTAGRAPAGWISAGHLLGWGVELYFTGRRGGYSPPPYDSLNLAYHTGDDAVCVSANRELVASALGVGEERFVYLDQVHGLRLLRAGADDATDRSAPHARSCAGVDGAYTTEEGLALAVLTADCLPISLSDRYSRVVAMLHAGWKGTAGDIAGKAVGMIASEFGLAAGDLRAVIGPGIGPCCYTVDEGRARLFVEKYGKDGGVVWEEGGFRLDLYRANRLNLLRAGLKEECIFGVGACTCCGEGYFSFRRDGNTGRQGAFVFLRRAAEVER